MLLETSRAKDCQAYSHVYFWSVNSWALCESSYIFDVIAHMFYSGCGWIIKSVLLNWMTAVNSYNQRRQGCFAVTCFCVLVHQRRRESVPLWVRGLCPLVEAHTCWCLASAGVWRRVRVAPLSSTRPVSCCPPLPGAVAEPITPHDGTHSCEAKRTQWAEACRPLWVFKCSSQCADI